MTTGCLASATLATDKASHAEGSDEHSATSYSNGPIGGDTETGERAATRDARRDEARTPARQSRGPRRHAARSRDRDRHRDDRDHGRGGHRDDGHRRRDYPSLGSGLWWAVQTTTTVGYGDHVPTTAAGQLLAAVVMLFGIGFLAIITAAITSTFVARRADKVGAEAPTAEQVHGLDRRLERIEAALADICAVSGRPRMPTPRRRSRSVSSTGGSNGSKPQSLIPRSARSRRRDESQGER